MSTYYPGPALAAYIGHSAIAAVDGRPGSTLDAFDSLVDLWIAYENAPIDFADDAVDGELLDSLSLSILRWTVEDL